MQPYTTLFSYEIMYTGVISFHTKGWHVAFACMAGVGLLAYARVKGTQPLEDKVYGVAGMLFILYGMILL